MRPAIAFFIPHAPLLFFRAGILSHLPFKAGFPFGFHIIRVFLLYHISAGLQRMKNLWKCLSVRVDADLQEMPVVGAGRKRGESWTLYGQII
jgi:hypothetical protein